MKLTLTQEPKNLLTVQFIPENGKMPFNDTGIFTGKHCATFYNRENNVLLVGLGKDGGPESIRRAAGTAAKAARQEAETIAVKLPDNSRVTINAVVEGIMLGNYRFLKYKTQSLEDFKQLKNVAIIGPKTLSPDFKEAVSLACAVCYARDLVSTPPMDLNPATLEQEAKSLAKKHALEFTVFDEQELKKRKMNAIVAVSQGSQYKARMLILEYKHPQAKKHVVCCGKGVCYDSGGYNLKLKMIEDMKDDMGGAAALLGTLDHLATIKAKVHVTVIIGAVENLISSTAYKPGDVITAMNGKTIEIVNTDAEGRVVLADCLSYASTIKHDLLFDIATLTGASMIALGWHAAAICTPNDALAESIIAAGERSGDRAWRLPMWDDYKADIKSEIADMKNLGFLPYAGVQSGAMLLQEFVEQPKKWLHIDMGCTVNTPKEQPCMPKGATGWGVRILSDFIRNVNT